MTVRASRTVKNRGILKYAGFRWQSDDLISHNREWVWIVPPEDAHATTIRIEDKEGTRLADAQRREPIV